VNVAGLVALGVTHYKGAERADPIFALGISGYMLWNSRHIGLRALTQLLDHEMPLDYREEIKAAVLACHGVRGIHDLRTRDAGDRVFVEFHLEVDADLTVQRGHAICDHVEREVKDLFKFSVDVSTHLEPAGIQDDRLDDMVARETP